MVVFSRVTFRTNFDDDMSIVIAFYSSAEFDNDICVNYTLCPTCKFNVDTLFVTHWA